MEVPRLMLHRGVRKGRGRTGDSAQRWLPWAAALSQSAHRTRMACTTRSSKARLIHSLHSLRSCDDDCCSHGSAAKVLTPDLL